MPKFWLSWFLSLIASLALTAIILVSLIFVFLESQLPDVSELKNIQLQMPLQVYTNDGKLIGEFGPIRRAPVSYDQIPPLMIKAVLATEDQRFFEHNGVDIYGLVRAAQNLLVTGQKTQGGSTITMQVARNFYLTRSKTYSRKLEEILLALKIDQELSKQKILELYLNKIYFGQQAYGVAAAAQVYFGKSLNQLTLPEIALLAGLPQAPSDLNPVSNPGEAKKRRDHVLERMYELGDIDKNAYLNAIATPMDATYHGRVIQIWAPYIGEMARSMMYANYGENAYTHSYKVYTTVDSNLQNYANQATRDGLLAYDERHGYRGPIKHLDNISPSNLGNILYTLNTIPNANGLRAAAVMDINSDNSADAMISNGEHINIPWTGISWTNSPSTGRILHKGDVIWVDKLSDGTWKLSQIPEAETAFISMNPNTGAITSLVGGFDFRLSNFNRVVQALRQPGSGFKPFIYSAALDKGYTLASVFNDAPLVLPDPSKPGGVWRPQNDTHKFYGPTRLRYALAQSRNLISIRLLQAIGIDYTIAYDARFGFTSNQLPHNLTMALGTCDITPLQLITAYSIFANGGYRISPYLIDHITDENGKVVYQYQIKPGVQVLSPETEFLMVSALRDVVDEGTGSKALTLGRSDLAGKTGTTDNDAWFNGFNSDMVATAWVGFDQPKPVHEYGAQAALPIWIEFMGNALQGTPEHTITQPDDIVSIKIDPYTGMLARPDQTNAIFEYFKQDDVPTDTAPDDSSPAGAGSSGDNGVPIF